YQSNFDFRFFFSEVFHGNEAGFDIVIGNPPYGAKLTKEEKEIFKAMFADVHMRTPDTFNYFISMSLTLLKNNGVLSFIVPNNLLFQTENTKTRDLLLNQNYLKRVINLGDNTFENADVPTCIFISIKRKETDYAIDYSDDRKETIETIDFFQIQHKLPKEEVNKVPNKVIGVSSEGVRIMREIEALSWKIDEIASEVASGISTGGDKIFRIPEELAQQRSLEAQILKPVLVGGEIDKYKIKNTKHYLIYTSRDTSITQYPVIQEYLNSFRDKLMQRSESKQGILPWFALGRQRYPELFEGEKIIMRQTADSIRATYDTYNYYVLNSILVFKLNPHFDISYKYVLLALNSKLNHYIYRNNTQEENRTFAEVKPQNVRKLYVPKLARPAQKPFEVLCDYLLFLHDVQSPSLFERVSNEAVAHYFQQVADACLLELIYGEEMRSQQVHVLEAVQNELQSIEKASTDTQKAAIILNVYQQWQLPESKVRNRLKIIGLLCPNTVGKILTANEED
ncbi:MAG: Eco57I restriction-modification methylase domain-containing protein, partial [Bacteroidia bacterium]